MVGVVDIYQRPGADQPHLCVGVIAQPMPPQCGGPTLLGEFSWSDTPHAEHQGARWTEVGYEVVGYLDLSAGAHGTFTLTRPIRQKDHVYPEHSVLDLPTLCSDPWRDADPEKTDNDAQHAFDGSVRDLPVVDVWSGGQRGDYGFNVLVQGDADDAHRALRAVWGGWLCVASSDEPTEAERQAAFDRMIDVLPANTMVSGSPGGGPDRVLELVLVAADEDLKSSIVAAAGPGMTVSITTIFEPYRG